MKCLKGMHDRVWLHANTSIAETNPHKSVCIPAHRYTDPAAGIRKLVSVTKEIGNRLPQPNRITKNADFVIWLFHLNCHTANLQRNSLIFDDLLHQFANIAMLVAKDELAVCHTGPIEQIVN